MKDFNIYLKTSGEVGFVASVIQSIVLVEGLPNSFLGEMVMFESGQFGQISALNHKNVEILVLSSNTVIVGTRVTGTGTPLQIGVGEGLLGNTVNALCLGQKTFEISEYRSVEVVPKGIVARKKITRQLITGVSMIDFMVPIGYGQRELMIGDRKTGKSYALWQILLAQARMGTVCIYVAVGKKNTEIAKVGQFLEEQGVRDKTVVVGAALGDSAAEIFLAPYTGMTIAEYFRDKGKDVLLILDDMSSHAKFYRELSLLSRKFPGRDSYPGDIFYVHSKLVERAGNFQVLDDKEVSITCLPVVETVQGDITGYIQTNMMSMTDGHIYFDSDLFFKGRRPAINPFVSVTRVGHQTQSSIAKECGRILLQLMNEYEKTQQFLRFGAELGENSRQILAMGDKVLLFFDQPRFAVLSLPLQIVLFASLYFGMWDGKHIDKALAIYKDDQQIRTQIDDAVAKFDTVQKLTEYLEVGGITLFLSWYEHKKTNIN